MAKSFNDVLLAFRKKKAVTTVLELYVKWFRGLRRDPSSTQRSLCPFVDGDSMDHDETGEAALEKQENVP